MLTDAAGRFTRPCRLFYLGYRTGVLQTYRLCPGGRDPHSPRHLVLFLYDCADEYQPSVVRRQNAAENPEEGLPARLFAVLIGGNWLLFIWAVNNHHMLEASLGYFY